MNLTILETKILDSVRRSGQPLTIESLSRAYEALPQPPELARVHATRLLEKMDAAPSRDGSIVFYD